MMQLKAVLDAIIDGLKAIMAATSFITIWLVSLFLILATAIVIAAGIEWLVKLLM